jgi:DNA-binding GntR family transcriptional regulator
VTAVESVTRPLDEQRVRVLADLEHGSLFELLAGGCKLSLAGADQRVVAVAIDGDEAALLEVPEGAPGLRFHTLARDDGGTPAYYATSLSHRYEVDLRQKRPSPTKPREHTRRSAGSGA